MENEQYDSSDDSSTSSVHSEASTVILCFHDAKDNFSDATETINSSDEEMHDALDLVGEEVIKVGKQVTVMTIEENQELVITDKSDESEPICNHHMSFDMNLHPIPSVLKEEWAFRAWYHITGGPATVMEAMQSFYMHKDTGVEEMIKELFRSEDFTHCVYNANYECLYQYLKSLKLAAIIPFAGTSISVILRYDLDLLHVELQGIKNNYIFNLMSIKDEYMINPHPRNLINISCPFVVLGLAAYRPTNSMFLLTQMGGQCILISLVSDDDFVFVNLCSEESITAEDISNIFHNTFRKSANNN